MQYYGLKFQKFGETELKKRQINTLCTFLGAEKKRKMPVRIRINSL